MCHILLAKQHGNAHREIRCTLQQPVVGIDDDLSGSSEGVDRIVRLAAGEIDAAILRLALGLDAQLHRHGEQIKVLGHGADGAEALAVAQPEDAVVVGKLRCSGSIQPLRKERRQLQL